VPDTVSFASGQQLDDQHPVRYEVNYAARGHVGRFGRETFWIWKGLDTVSIIRKGATKNYSDGWEVAFGKKSGKKTASATAVKAKKGAKKKAGKKKK
jgi:hypothetical protein